VRGGFVNHLSCHDRSLRTPATARIVT
jgi:hypothetical protein